MGQFGHALMPQRRRRALQRMGRPEDLLKDLGVTLLLLELEDAGFHRLEQFLGLVQKELDVLAACVKSEAHRP